MMKRILSAAILFLIAIQVFSKPAKYHKKKSHRIYKSHYHRVPSDSGVPDSVYVNRLSALPFQFDMTYNPMVRKFIEFYTVHYKRKLQQVVGLGEIYFPLMDSIFRSYHVPEELKYVTIIESSLNPLAISPYHTSGLWQFVAGTGKLYGLTINNYVDERLCVIKSTKAAAKYFKKLYDIYNDWTLALAAYNCGSGFVSKAIRITGKRDYQSVSRYLPAHTREYIPQFIGAAYACNYYKEHNIVPIPAPSPLLTDTVMITKQTHLQQVSRSLNISITVLRQLNPQYVRNIIPGTRENPYTLILPEGQKEKFASLSDSINQVSGIDHDKAVALSEKSAVCGRQRIIHRVKAGESIFHIASRYKVSVKSLRAWNHLSGKMVRKGQRIVVYVQGIGDRG